jgi:hypothetical protein
MNTENIKIPEELAAIIARLQPEKEDFSKAVYHLVGIYLDMEIAHWTQENLRFEQKWKMDFDQFENTRYSFPDGNSYEMDMEYMDWLDAYSFIIRFQKFKEQWTQIHS